MPALRDLTGQKFGRLTVVRRAENSAAGAARWLCRCDCGNEAVVRGQALLTGKTKSCGCFNLETHARVCVERNTTHGQSGSRTNRAWSAMLQRCRNPKATGYSKYGARGVIVCERWDSFENFLADMGECLPGLQIDRIDSNGNYEPGNCRWLDATGQQRNRRNNRRITANGVTLTLAEWAQKTGLGRTTISERIKRGWSAEDALKT